MTDELTTSERDELMALRKRMNELQNKEDAPVVSNEPENGTTLPATHWLHLADGSVVESNGVKSSHGGIQVIGAYAKPNEMVQEAAPGHVF